MKSMKNIVKRLSLAGLLLAGITALSPAQAQDNKPKDNDKPTVLDNFIYPSHRNFPAIDGKCYEGKLFDYNLLSNDTIAQADKNRVIIEPLWFYDIDNDGKFGKAEIAAIKKGIPIFMNQAFNDIANAEMQKFLEKASEYGSLEAQLKDAEKNSETQKGNYEKQLTEYKTKLSKLEAELKEDQDKITQHEAMENADHSLINKLTDDLQKAKTPAPLQTQSPKGPSVPPYYWTEGETQKQNALPLPPVPPLPEIVSLDSPQAKQETPKPQVPKQKKDYRGVWLQAQETANMDFDSYITSIGARVNPFKNLNIGFGANLDLGFGLDKQTDSYSAPLSAGRTASGTSTDTGKFSIGGSVEAQFGPIIIGGGIDYKLWTQQVLEQILSSSGDVLKSNTNSTPNRQVFGKGYGGVEIPIGDNFKLGAVVGYNGKDGGYFGLRGTIKVK